MKKEFILLASIVLVGCSTPADEFQKAAEKQVQITIKELAKHPESVKLSDFSAVYKTDSLCILHFDFTAKNGLGNESTDLMEYIFYQNQGVIYESCSKADADSIYLNPKALDKEKKGKIYESLDYDSAIAYRAALHLNDQGRVVGDPDSDVDIPVPTGTGHWELKGYKDDFDEETGEKYLLIKGKGHFSNSATTGSKMSAYLFVDRDGASLRLIEYNSSVVKDDELCFLKIKDANGDVYTWLLSNKKVGQMYVDSYYKEDLQKILNREGIVTFHGEMGKYTKSEYSFKIDLTGYKNAKKYL